MMCPLQPFSLFLMKEKGLILVTDLILYLFLVLPSEPLVASIVISILSHLRPSRVPNPWYRYRLHLGFLRS